MKNSGKAKTNTEKLNSVTDTLPDFVQQYFYSGNLHKSVLTKLNYALDIRHFLEYAIESFEYLEGKSIKDLSVNDIKKIRSSDIDRYLTWMDLECHLSARTRARRRSSISVLFEYLINTQKKLEHNPVTGSAKIEIPVTDKVVYLSLKDQEKLLDCIKNGTGLSARQLSFHERFRARDLAIVFLFLDTGLKLSELQSLNISDVVIFDDLFDDNRSDCYIMINRKDSSKALTTVKIYFSDESKEYIQNYLKYRNENGQTVLPESPLFITSKGERLSVREIQQMIRKYIFASLGRSDITVNSLRSSFAMEFYKHEKDMLLLKKRMGHTSMNSTNVYVRAAQKEESEKASRNWRSK